MSHPDSECRIMPYWISHLGCDLDFVLLPLDLDFWVKSEVLSGCDCCFCAAMASG
ncbi:hypothetical protein FH972_027314 [Carpinus fangiana]|uniref:Uncharacterized protein n=1 Tax=Carpinus fangiana TaxID=176857 RepID=A0A5N6NZG4_9ROSI|nr:hypothetical protein FH972_027314 [Carpinus fangiana]